MIEEIQAKPLDLLYMYSKSCVLCFESSELSVYITLLHSSQLSPNPSTLCCCTVDASFKGCQGARGFLRDYMLIALAVAELSLGNRDKNSRSGPLGRTSSSAGIRPGPGDGARRMGAATSPAQAAGPRAGAPRSPPALL